MTGRRVLWCPPRPRAAPRLDDPGVLRPLADDDATPDLLAVASAATVAVDLNSSSSTKI